MRLEINKFFILVPKLHLGTENFEVPLHKHSEAELRRNNAPNQRLGAREYPVEHSFLNVLTLYDTQVTT